MSEFDKIIINTQATWKRTHTGRAIRPEALKMLASEYDQDRGFSECNNCNYVGAEEWFLSGCPNCGSQEKNQ